MGVADLVMQANGDAFALFSCFEETSVGVPDESRAAMPMALLVSCWIPRHPFGRPRQMPLGMLRVRATSRRPCCAA